MPSPEALAAARLRHQAALEQGMPGTVTISGQPIACSLYLGPIELRQRNEGGGFVRSQQLKVWIGKDKLPVKPAMDVRVINDGVEFQIGSIFGDLAREAAWHILCHRWID